MTQTRLPTDGSDFDAEPTSVDREEADKTIDEFEDAGRDQNVRYISFWEDPELDEGTLLVRYTPNKPNDTVTMFNFETESRRTCTLVEFSSTGGWTSIDEAAEMVPDIAEDVLGDYGENDD